MSKLFESFFRKVRVYLKVTKATGIARRYFVMNGFDGAMTTFGIVFRFMDSRSFKTANTHLSWYRSMSSNGTFGFLRSLHG